MNKFKIGDEVRITNSNCYRYNHTGIIKSMSMSRYQIEHYGELYSYVAGDFELVDDKIDLDLEQLIEMANKGRSASAVLFDKFSDRVLYGGETIAHGVATGKLAHRGWMYSLAKPKPEFDNFTTKEGWEVKYHTKAALYNPSFALTVNGKSSPYSPIIQIECKIFDADILHEDLRTLLIQNMPSARGVFSACKGGIKFQSHVLNWDDAERIFNQLEAIK